MIKFLKLIIQTTAILAWLGTTVQVFNTILVQYHTRTVFLTTSSSCPLHAAYTTVYNTEMSKSQNVNNVKMLNNNLD